MKYGATYGLADFFQRLIPARDLAANKELLRATCEGLKRLAELQNSNPWITIVATVSAGVWIHYQGRKFALINPAQNYLRVGAAYRHTSAAEQMKRFFGEAIDSGNVAEVESAYLDQWRFNAEALPKVWEFFEKLEYPTEQENDEIAKRHPRTFFGADRELALEEFERGGRICPGVASIAPSHKVGSEDRLVFDHILPYSKGGASTYANLNVMCQECNAKKGATAL